MINDLDGNKSVFEALFKGISKEEYVWRPAPNKWCVLEILCHLYDEEREDFKARVKHLLETPTLAMPGINPEKLVQDRKYIDWDYDETLVKLLNERQNSISWLQSLKGPKWDNAFQHPQVGPITASMILINWPAHDLLHIRQVLHTRFLYLQHLTNESLEYAGCW